MKDTYGVDSKGGGKNNEMTAGDTGSEELGMFAVIGASLYPDSNNSLEVRILDQVVVSELPNLDY